MARQVEKERQCPSGRGVCQRGIRRVARRSAWPPSGKLQELVDDATRFNRDAGVSGVLLFDGTLPPILGGPPDGLDVVFSRVLGASSHHDLIELQRGRSRIVACLTGLCAGCLWKSKS